MTGTAEGVAPSRTPEYRRAYDAYYRSKNRDKRRQWDRDRAARLMAERAHGACAACNAPLSASNKIGICRPCSEFEAAAANQKVVDLWFAGRTLREIAEVTGRTKNYVGVTLTTLRAAGLSIPRRKPFTGEWADPLPTQVPVVQPGDLARGVRARRGAA